MTLSQQQNSTLTSTYATPTVLIFDSGMGGLTIYQAIFQRLPQLNYIYAFDNGGFPYGDKPDQLIISRVCRLIEKISQQIPLDLVVIACNTASTLVLPALRAQFSFPIVGVVPAIKPAVAMTQNNIIGLLATKATIKRQYTHDLIDKYADKAQVKLLGISELAKIAEQKLLGQPVDLEKLKTYLLPWIVGEQTPDTVVLGCTHYPLIKTELMQVFPEGTQFVDSGEAIAKRVEHLLADDKLNEEKAQLPKQDQDKQEKMIQYSFPFAVQTTHIDAEETLKATLRQYGFHTLYLYKI